MALRRYTPRKRDVASVADLHLRQAILCQQLAIAKCLEECADAGSGEDDIGRTIKRLEATRKKIGMVDVGRR
jgi:hypothetical protein